MSKREPKTFKELRAEFRYTLEQMSEGTGIPYGTIVGYNYQNRKMPLDNAKKIAEFLGIAVEDIKTTK